MEKKRLLILDGNSLLYRAFYAIPELTTSDGIHTNAVYGFTSMLLRMIDELTPDYIVTAFDRAAPTFRHVEYGEYKLGRKKTPDELSMQFPIVRDLLSKLAINIFELDGYEADDLIGTLSVFAENNGIESYIVTGDKDALQLATDNVKVVINKKGMTEKEIYDKERMITELGVTPKQFIDVKGLMGDKSDNIPGVPGIGEKTAYKLVKEYGNIENLLNNLDKVSGKKLKESLIEYSEQAIFSKKLATIITDVPVDIDLESIKSKEEFDIKGIRELFYKLQFKSLLEKVEKINGNANEAKDEPIVNAEYTDINKVSDLNQLIIDLEKSPVYALFDVKDTNVFSKLYLNKLYLNYEGNNYSIHIQKLINENMEETIQWLKKVFQVSQGKIISHSVKNAYSAMLKLGVDLSLIKFDTEIAAYLIESSKSEYSLKTLVEEYLRESFQGEEENLFVNGLSFLPKLYEVQKTRIEGLNMENLLYNIEQPLTKAIALMECEGFNIDNITLDTLGKKFKEEIDSLTKEIYELADESFNINSPKQLGKILFEKLDLPVIKKTKTGYSTNAEVLEALKGKHPILEKILYYRQITKLYSTYIEGLKAVIDVDGRIHSNFTQTVTTTGRLSSTEPNLQNIPIKYENGRAIRKVFIPFNEESMILSADYSQIELRVLAHISGDDNLISAFTHSSDIHTKTASEVFGVPVEEVTKTMRSNAKAVNFGIVYGIGDFSLAQDLGISKAQAKEYIDTYLERYPKVKEYMDKVVEEAEGSSYVTTILNRRRFIPEVNSSNKVVKALGKRLAMNAPIQGSAADIIKIAMVNVHKKLLEKQLKSKLILQVHDELILNVYKDELEQVSALVKEEMENVLSLSVPLVADVSVGENWYEAK
ncbi:DNA polymerase I [Clostridium sp. UBA4548]|uniref:DNA polymerase I n=1 Tax=Clostridium sp. UBA4548 TaxID=1946361 RepID=UPI0025BF0B58|nr:DNA polymerase I [Clostridium sp. UBA4548]